MAQVSVEGKVKINNTQSCTYIDHACMFIKNFGYWSIIIDYV